MATKLLNSLKVKDVEEIKELLISRKIKIEDLKDTKFFGDKDFVLNLVENEIIDEDELYNYKIGEIFYSNIDCYSNFTILGVDISDNGPSYEYDLGHVDIDIAREEAWQHFNDNGYDVGDGNYIIEKEKEWTFFINNYSIDSIEEEDFNSYFYRTNFDDWYYKIQIESYRTNHYMERLQLRNKDIKFLKKELRI